MAINKNELDILKNQKKLLAENELTDIEPQIDALLEEQILQRCLEQIEYQIDFNWKKISEDARTLLKEKYSDWDLKWRDSNVIVFVLKQNLWNK